MEDNYVPKFEETEEIPTFDETEAMDEAVPSFENTEGISEEVPSSPSVDLPVDEAIAAGATYGALRAGGVATDKVADMAGGMSKDMAFETMGGERTKGKKLLAKEEMGGGFVGSQDIGKEGLDKGLLSRDGLAKSEKNRKEIGQKLQDKVMEIDSINENMIDLQEFEQRIDAKLTKRYGNLVEKDKVKQRVLNKFYTSPMIEEKMTRQVPRESVEYVTSPLGNKIPQKTTVIEDVVDTKLKPKKISLDEFTKFKEVIKDLPDSEKLSPEIQKMVQSELSQYPEDILKRTSGSENLLKEYRDLKKRYGTAKEATNLLKDEFIKMPPSGPVKTAIETGMEAATLPLRTVGMQKGGGLLTQFIPNTNHLKKITAKTMNSFSNAIKSPAGQKVLKTVPLAGAAIAAAMTYDNARANGLTHDEAIIKTTAEEGAEAIPGIGQVMLAMESEELGGRKDSPSRMFEDKEITGQQLSEFKTDPNKFEKYLETKKKDARNAQEERLNYKEKMRSWVDNTPDQITQLAEQLTANGDDRYGRVLSRISKSPKEIQKNLMFSLWQDPGFRNAIKLKKEEEEK